MLDFTWKIFLETGNIDAYLLYKEIQQENGEIPEYQRNELAEKFPYL